MHTLCHFTYSLYRYRFTCKCRTRVQATSYMRYILTSLLNFSQSSHSSHIAYANLQFKLATKKQLYYYQPVARTQPVCRCGLLLDQNKLTKSALTLWIDPTTSTLQQNHTVFCVQVFIDQVYSFSLTQHNQNAGLLVSTY